MRYVLMVVCLSGILLGLGIPIMAQEAETQAKVIQPKEKLIQAFENTAKAKNFRMEGKMDIEMEMGGEAEETGSNVEITFKGVNKAPDFSHMTITSEMMGTEQAMELYRQGDNVVMKNPMTDEWTRMPSTPMGLMPSDQIAMFKEHIKDAKLVGEEKINQKDCVVIEASLNLEGIQEMMKKQPGMPTEMNFEKAQLKAWCGKEDSLIYKVSVLTESIMEGGPDIFPPGEEGEEEETPQKMTMKMTMGATYSDYDKEVAFEIPDEVKKILEEKEEGEPEEEELEEEEE